MYGPNLRFQQSFRRSRRAAADGYIRDIDSTRDEVLWVIRDPRPGVYQVRIRQSCEMSSAGTKYVFETDGDRIESAVMPTRNWGDFRDTVIGTITIPDDDVVVLSLRATEEPRETLFLLSQIELVPVSSLGAPVE